MKNIAIALSCSLLLLSCNTWKEAQPAPLHIPAHFDAKPEFVVFDSLKSGRTIPTRDAFFSDAILRAHIDTALKNNFDFRIAFEKIKQQEAHMRLMKGVLLPELGIQLGAGTRKFGDYTIDGVGNYDTQFSPNLTDKQRIPEPAVPDFNTSFITRWEIDIWGKLRAQKKAALHRYLATQSGQQFLQTQLIALVADSYYRLVLLDERIRLIESNISLQENALQISEAQKLSGNSNQLAVDIIEAEILAARNELLALRKIILQEENAFNVLLGRYPQAVARASWSQQIKSPFFEAGVESQLLANRPDIQAAMLDLKANDAELTAAKKAFFPNLVINGSLGLNAFRAALLLDAPSSFAYQLFGGMVAPLLNRRELKANLLAAQSKKREQYLVLEKTIVTAFSEVYQLIQSDQILQQQTDLKTQQVAILNRSIETSNSLFVSGRATYLEIINAQQSYLNAQLELLDLYQQQQELTIHLYRAIGGGK